MAPYKRSRIDSGTLGQERLFAQTDCSAQGEKSAKEDEAENNNHSSESMQEVNLTPLNQLNQRKSIIVDSILDEDYGAVQATSRFEPQVPEAAAEEQPENLFKTPSPSGKNLKFDLSGLDDKQKTIMIPDPAIASATMTHAETTEKV